ncbi:MAG: DinB family protein, partial [candidate division Zixibacteria bacterium]|nr:DinB family protein [candidate division Zixibacteria bacterium]
MQKKTKSEVRRITQQFKAAYTGPAWHGPSVKQVLKGVTAVQAAARPVKEAHSIWEIALHVAGWQKVVARRAKGEKIRQPDEGDWPTVGVANASNWKRTLQNLDKSYRNLHKTISGLSDADLTKRVRGIKNYRYIILHGVIQHNLYHAGQIMLLKKALGVRRQ